MATLEELYKKLIGTTLGNMISLRRQINYYKNEIEPFISRMEEFERKEYILVNESNILDYEKNKNTIIQNESVFNDLLSISGVNMSVVVFISKIESL